MFRYCWIIVATLLFSGCSSLAVKDDWHPSLPAQPQFVESYEADVANQQYQSRDNYIAWIRRFFFGTPLQPQGWLEMTEEVVQTVAVEEQAALNEQMLRMGTKISKEWAKDNRTRKINTKNMIVWGNALKESVVNNDVIDLVSRVEQDVDALLSGELHHKKIDSDRYYVMEFDEFF